MSGRPDFDVGDLVVCVDDSPCGLSGDALPVKRGQVVAVDGLESNSVPYLPGVWWFVRLDFLSAWISAERFRKVDKLPPKFFAGDIDVAAPAPEQVTA